MGRRGALSAREGVPTLSITAWSFSRWNTYDQCPAKFLYQVVEKAPFEQTKAMKRGDDIHKGLAMYFKNIQPSIPAEITHKGALALIDDVHAAPDKIIEEQWGYAADWKPAAWFGPLTWFRNICDAAVFNPDMTVDALDWKSGSKYGSGEAQMETQALAIFARFKPVVTVRARMVYFDKGDEDPAEFQRKDYEKLKDKWTKRAAQVLGDTTWLPRPGEQCLRCQFAKSKGGKCRYG